MSLSTDHESGGELEISDGRARAIAIAAALRRAARKSSAPVSFVSGGGGFRARKGDRLFLQGLIASAVLMVALPVLVASVYFGLIASNQYVTQFEFSLRNGDSSALDALSGIAGMAASQQSIDSQVLVNFIPSRAMVEKLDGALDLRKIYSRPEADWWSRFDPRKKIEDLEKYWYYRVDAWVDSASSIVTVRVRAFTPEDSLELAREIDKNCEQLINDMTARAREDALRAGKIELDRSETALSEATRAMREARNAEGTVDAAATAAGIERIIGQLQLDLARLQQQREVSVKTISLDAPQMKIISAAIENRKKQVSDYQAQIAGGDGGGKTLADSMSRLGNLETMEKLAQQRYATAAVQFENARIDTESQHAFLVDVAPPSLPQKALYPRRLWGWFIVVFPSFILWSLLTGLAYLVRDNTAQ